MNGGHDLGGQHGFGPVNPELEKEEPIFHHDWERRAFAITLACGFLGKWNIDEARYAREFQNPVNYLTNSYYENWLYGLETLLVQKGLITEKELLLGKSDQLNDVSPVPGAERVREILASGGPTHIEDSRLPKFQCGQRVKVCNNHPIGHTRIPRYTRGCEGVIERLHGVHIFPDMNAQGESGGEHLYNVQFEAEVLWGKHHEVQSSVYVDLWEPYLVIVEL